VTGRTNFSRGSLALALALVGAFLAAPSPVSAQFVPDGKWWKRPRIAAAIDLTADQEKQLDAIFIRTRPKLIDLKAEVEKREFDFQTAMEEGSTTDRKVIAARIEAREEARGKLQKELVLMVLDMKQVLRKEQWEKLTRMQQQVRERRREMKEDERGLGLRPQAPLQRQPPPPAGDARRPGAAATAPTPGRSPNR
jgi:Spy/CpxP family protein refolding chaperone